MMKSLGRFVLRSGGLEPDETPSGLILGACFVNQGVLKANRMYELREVMGTVHLFDMGPALIGAPRERKPAGLSWGRSVNDILDEGKFHLLTVDEYRQYLVKAGAIEQDPLEALADIPTLLPRML